MIQSPGLVRPGSAGKGRRSAKRPRIVVAELAGLAPTAKDNAAGDRPRRPRRGVGMKVRVARGIVAAALTLVLGWFSPVPVQAGVEPGGVVAMAATPSGNGYWLLTARGEVTSFGKARRFGDFPDARAPYTALVATPSGRGLWALTEDGRVARLGHARNLGDFSDDDGENPCCRGLVALERTPSGRGLWVLDDVGRVFQLGDARNLGDFASDDDTGDPGTCCAGLVALQVTPSGRGLWALDDVGRVFQLGDARDLGDFASDDPDNPCCSGLVALERTPSGKGLWAAQRDGRVVALGDARLFDCADCFPD